MVETLAFWSARVGVYNHPCGGNVVTVTDDSKPWQRTIDALCRLTKIVESAGKPDAASTYYLYDSLDNVTCAAQDGGSDATLTSCSAAPASWRPRSFSYDGLSRLLQAFNPETGWTCCGTTGSVPVPATGRVVGDQQRVPGFSTSPTAPQPQLNCTALSAANGLAYCYDLAGDGTASSFPQRSILFSQAFNNARRLTPLGSQVGGAQSPSYLFQRSGKYDSKWLHANACTGCLYAVSGTSELDCGNESHRQQ